jgi:UTP--glucose-1-phosphate uridylyltransferase
MKKVKKAIIPAAGLGSRMFPYTKGVNKLMLPILNKPSIHYLVDELVKSGIKEIIISGRNLDMIKNYFKNDPNLLEMTSKFGHKGALPKLKKTKCKCKIHYIEQKKPMGWMYEIYNSKNKINNEPFAVVLSDILYNSKEPALKQVIKQFEKSKTNIYSVGRYIFNPTIFKILKKQRFKKGDDYTVVNNVFNYIETKESFLNYSIKGKRFTIGEPINYLKTITFFALQNKEVKKDYLQYLKSLKLIK